MVFGRIIVSTSKCTTLSKLRCNLLNYSIMGIFVGPLYIYLGLDQCEGLRAYEGHDRMEPHAYPLVWLDMSN